MIQSVSSHLMESKTPSTRKISSYTLNESGLFFASSPASPSHSHSNPEQSLQWIVPTSQQFLIPPITRSQWIGKKLSQLVSFLNKWPHTQIFTRKHQHSFHPYAHAYKDQNIQHYLSPAGQSIQTHDWSFI
jgi:hypothetical protein